MALKFPVIFLCSSHLDRDELYALEEQIPTLTYDHREAQVFLGKVARKERALFELRRVGLHTREVVIEEAQEQQREHAIKRRKLDGSSTGSSPALDPKDSLRSFDGDTPDPVAAVGDRVRFVNLAWFTDSISKGEVLPLDDYIIYEGIRVEDQSQDNNDLTSTHLSTQLGTENSKRQRDSKHVTRPSLTKETTFEHDDMPPLPNYLQSIYSCQRPTRIDNPNADFIQQLKKIRTVRLLDEDKVGVRAYSTAIASIGAYPYPLKTRLEVERLPGCSAKITALYHEWRETGVLKEVEDAASNPRLKVLHDFYSVWGVGEATAREWYKKGWRDLDDVVEHGWDSLTRVQQIGIKCRDDFLLKIPREEVERIGRIVLAQANKIRPGFEMVIAGGYRRGKEESGDVDLILSHRDEAATRNFITALVDSLCEDNYVTHTLIHSTRNSERGQMPAKWKGTAPQPAGSGFDSLDKALVAWREPRPPGDGGGSEENDSPTRRVDIIVSPWKTVGCAVLGWTSGTTFQRDLRRYCADKLDLKFDSGGITSRATGDWVDMESRDGLPAPDMLTAERRVFEGLNLQWRPPEERNTD